MALSDSCADTIYELSQEVVNYADWRYHPSELTHIFDALHSLALFVARQDNYQALPDAEMRVISGRIVLSTILGFENDDIDTLILKLIADVSKVNNNLSLIIDEVYGDFINSADELKEDLGAMVYKLEAVIKLRDTK
jgi:hypothetical protein